MLARRGGGLQDEKFVEISKSQTHTHLAHHQIFPLCNFVTLRNIIVPTSCFSRPFPFKGASEQDRLRNVFSWNRGNALAVV